QIPDIDTVLYAVGFDRTSGRTHREVSCNGLANVLAEIASRACRIIFISSSSVYGQTSGEWVDEDSPCEPVRENGRICLDAERLVGESGTAGLDARILRLSGIYGPGRLLQRVESLRQRIPIGGNPDAWLNLIHVDDAVHAVLACDERGRAGRSYLVSDDRPLPRREYYSLLAKLVDAPPPLFSDAAANAHNSRVRPLLPEAGPSQEAQPSQDSPSSRRTPRDENDFNKRCRNTRIKLELDVSLRYPSVHEGLPASLANLS
ncbi:MAG: NAD-dependent epimerase/dehydratase family protein, partial [Planctomycetaceae bacterium]|nr:NAD-dependent epimerase/dehydratase family protein [Planctomycetaceae bacterium]